MKEYGYFYLVGWKDEADMKAAPHKPRFRYTQPVYDLSIDGCLSATKKMPQLQGAILVAGAKLYKFLSASKAAIVTRKNDAPDKEARLFFDGLEIHRGRGS